MASLRARIVNLALPLLGIKSFFSEPELMHKRLAKARTRKSERPKAKWRASLDIAEEDTRGFPVVTIAPQGGARNGAPHLFYLHGGGYVLDVAGVHFETVCKLCSSLGASATVPVYPLAPEHQAPEILAAMRALWRSDGQARGGDDHRHGR